MAISLGKLCLVAAACLLFVALSDSAMTKAAGKGDMQHHAHKLTAKHDMAHHGKKEAGHMKAKKKDDYDDDDDEEDEDDYDDYDYSGACDNTDDRDDTCCTCQCQCQGDDKKRRMSVMKRSELLSRKAGAKSRKSKPAGKSSKLAVAKV